MVSTKVVPSDEHQITVAADIDLSGRANQLPPIIPVELAPTAQPVESVVSLKAMGAYDSHCDPEAEGCTCHPIPPAMVQGTNRLCLKGRLIFGNDLGYFVSAHLLFFVPSVCMVYGVLEEERHLVFAVLSLFMAGTMKALMWATACMDPGIIPRDSYPVDVNPDTTLIRDGVAYKWCRTCHIYRPPRTKHCPVCDNCVDRFDHHCPWVGTCIGRRNYRYFFGFISVTLINAVYMLCMSIVFLHNKHAGGVGEAFEKSFYWILPVALSALAVPLVGSLVVYHIYLIKTNMTTNEDLNNVYDTEENPFQLGCYKNLMSVVFGTQRSSRLVASSSTHTMQAW